MRIGVTSDIHADVSEANQQIADLVAAAALESDLDVLAVCGDISPDIMTFSKTLTSLSKLDPKCKKLFVAGNHDIWLPGTNKSITSYDKYSLITKVCSEHGFHHLGSSPLIIGEVAFCGTIGWYDYSFRNSRFQIPLMFYEGKTFGSSIWNDVNYARWNASDQEVEHRFETELRHQIASVRNSVSRIVVATHHVPFRECVTYKEKLPGDFFCAFMGSDGLGQICADEPLVTHVFFGHSHSPCVKQIGRIEAVCSPVGYLTDPPNDLQEYARSRLQIVELPERETEDL